MSYIECPKCHFQFNAEENFKERIDGPSSFFKVTFWKRLKPIFKKGNGLDEISESILTICPNCKHEYPFSEYKFFGFLSAKSLKRILIMFILGFIVVAFGVLINDIMK